MKKSLQTGKEIGGSSRFSSTTSCIEDSGQMRQPASLGLSLVL